jgi:hypothetical protein
MLGSKIGSKWRAGWRSYGLVSCAGSTKGLTATNQRSQVRVLQGAPTNCASTICCSPGNHVSVWFDPLVSRTIPRSRAVFGTNNESDRDRCFSRTLSSKKFSR